MQMLRKGIKRTTPELLARIEDQLESDSSCRQRRCLPIPFASVCRTQLEVTYAHYPACIIELNRFTYLATEAHVAATVPTCGESPATQNALVLAPKRRYTFN